MPKLINIQQMMVLFGVTRRTIYRWRIMGRLPEPIKKWGSPRWELNELLDDLRNGKEKIAGQANVNEAILRR